MRRHTLAIALLALLIAFSSTDLAIAQVTAESTGQIRVTEPTSGLQPIVLSYGFGPQYTDGTDHPADVEIPPFPPPGDSFGAWFNRECDDPDFEGEPCYWKSDFRGVPDSVGEESEMFSLFFDVGLHNNTGQPLTIAVLNPDYPRYADSIVLADPSGRGFRKTLTGPEVFELPNEFVSRILMTVYFNLNQSSAPTARIVALQELVARPNPVIGDRVVLEGDFHPGDNVTLFDISGEEVSRQVISESIDRVTLEVSNRASGSLLVQWNSAEGMLKGRVKLSKSGNSTW